MCPDIMVFDDVVQGPRRPGPAVNVIEEKPERCQSAGGLVLQFDVGLPDDRCPVGLLRLHKRAELGGAHMPGLDPIV